MNNMANDYETVKSISDVKTAAGDYRTEIELDTTDVIILTTVEQAWADTMETWNARAVDADGDEWIVEWDFSECEIAQDEDGFTDADTLPWHDISKITAHQ
jgi:hypothetical protein